MSDFMPRMSYVCRHIMGELNGRPADKLNDPELLEGLLFEAARLVYCTRA